MNQCLLSGDDICNYVVMKARHDHSMFIPVLAVVFCYIRHYLVFLSYFGLFRHFLSFGLYSHRCNSDI